MPVWFLIQLVGECKQTAIIAMECHLYNNEQNARMPEQNEKSDGLKSVY